MGEGGYLNYRFHFCPYSLYPFAVFFNGEICGASDFDADTLYCRFKVVTDNEHWDLLDGQAVGQTHEHTILVSDPYLCLWDVF